MCSVLQQESSQGSQEGAPEAGSLKPGIDDSRQGPETPTNGDLDKSCGLRQGSSEHCQPACSPGKREKEMEQAERPAEAGIAWATGKVWRSEYKTDAQVGPCGDKSLKQLAEVSKGHDAQQGRPSLQFAILFSAYRSPAPAAEALHALDLPSLHVYSQDNNKRKPQIPLEESVAVHQMFCKEQCNVARVAKGHAIPTDKQFLICYRSFLSQFVKHR